MQKKSGAWYYKLAQKLLLIVEVQMRLKAVNINRQTVRQSERDNE